MANFNMNEGECGSNRSKLIAKWCTYVNCMYVPAPQLKPE